MIDKHEVAGRAAEAARILTVRGILIRAASAGGALLLLTLVAPAELGLLATVRSIALLIEQGGELGLVWPLMRQSVEPDRDDYAGLAGAQFLTVLSVLAIAVVWHPASTAFGALDPRWRGWLLAVIGCVATTSLGTGARVRLERQFRYGRLAFIEVTALLVHVLVLAGFVLARHFAMGVFIAQIAITLYLNGLLYLSSPGPWPTWHVGRAVQRVKSSAGYSFAYAIFVAREQAPPLLLAATLGLQVAGVWAFAVRLASFLQFAHEGFARVALPAAARMAPDRVALRGLAARSFIGAGVVAIPAAALVVFALPTVPLFWPQWAPGVPLARIYVPCAAIVGVMGAALGPIALTLRGWRAVLFEHALPLLVTCAGILLLWYFHSDALQYVVIPLNIAAIAGLLIITEAEVWPAWDPELTRVVLALAGSFAVYGICVALKLHPVITAACAAAVLVACMGPQRLLSFSRVQQTSL